MIGEHVGAYVIERELGRGGMGVVYVGVDARLGRRAAIKQLRPALSGEREMVERFFNEAKAAASVDHPGIVEVYDVGWHTDGSAYFAMKLLDGDSLARRLRAGTLEVATALALARQIASALAAAHAAGIVHRDLKPDNIVLVPDDEVAIGERATVLDFGIAKLFGEAGMSQTRTDSVLGTPSYMSPEQCRGAGLVDHRTDVYALGCILFEMLAGRPPFVGAGAGEVLGMHQFVAAPALRSLRPDVPPDVEAVVTRALAKSLDERYASMAELLADLQALAPGPRVSRVRPAAGPSAARAGASTSAVTKELAHAATVANVSSAELAQAATVANVPSAKLAQDATVALGRPAAPRTTLSASRGEVTAPVSKPRGRKLGWLVALVVIAAGAAAAVVVMQQRDDGARDVRASAAPSPAPPSPAPAAPPEAPVIAVDAAPRELAEPIAAPAPAPPEPPEPPEPPDPDPAAAAEAARLVREACLDRDGLRAQVLVRKHRVAITPALARLCAGRGIDLRSGVSTAPLP